MTENYSIDVFFVHRGTMHYAQAYTPQTITNVIFVVSQFQVYIGKIETVERNFGSRVVKDLTRSLVGNYHRVFFDNHFNDVQLQKYLLKDKIYACGTTRKGRKLEPKDLKEDKGGYGLENHKRRHSTLNGWTQNQFDFLSNFHNPDDVKTISRKRKDGSSVEFPCLSCTGLQNYKVERISLIYSVACGLIGADPETAQRGPRSSNLPVNKFRVTVPPEIKYDTVAHLPVHGLYIYPFIRVWCARCSTRSNPHRTRWHCSTSQVGLCLTDKSNCFYAFHKK
ncbi:hypothetical protein NQ318_023516, partial [Aromia moschata]